MDEVVIVKYDPKWIILFERESELIRLGLNESLLTRIEHFGSTAIPGLAAKPIVDGKSRLHKISHAKS